MVFIQPEVCPKSSELLECLSEHLILHTYGLDKTRMPERQLHHLQYLLGQSLQLCTPITVRVSPSYWVAEDRAEERTDARFGNDLMEEVRENIIDQSEGRRYNLELLDARDYRANDAEDNQYEHQPSQQ